MRLFCFLPRLLAAALGLCLWAGTVHAEPLIMTAPPREKPDAGEKLYAPLAEHLAKLIGREVVYEHPRNWLNYQRDMRNGKYDIVFDGPHFAAWRMVHLNHDVPVRLPGSLKFLLFTSKNNNQVNSPDDLIGKKFCGIPPPNLSTLSIIGAFRNPVRQPVVHGVRGGMGAVYKAFKNGECDAAVVRDTFYNKKLNDEQRAELKIIFRPDPLPNQSITVSSKLTAEEKRLIARSLTDPNSEGVKAAQGILSRFGGKNAKAFIRANAQEFNEINFLLEGVIFGW